MYYFENRTQLIERILEIAQNYDEAASKSVVARTIADRIAWRKEADSFVQFADRLCRTQ